MPILPPLSLVTETGYGYPHGQATQQACHHASVLSAKAAQSPAEQAVCRISAVHDNSNKSLITGGARGDMHIGGRCNALQESHSSSLLLLSIISVTLKRSGELRGQEKE